MKNNKIKRFNQYINESVLGLDNSMMVQLDMASETLKNWAMTLADLAEIAPNCVFVEFMSVTPDYWEVTISGSKMECSAIAKYWNDLTGADETTVMPFRSQRNKRY